MRLAAFALIVAALGCAAFAWWGVQTPAGRRAFDEMDGIIPLAAVPLGILLLAAGLALLWRHRRRGTGR